MNKLVILAFALALTGCRTHREVQTEHIVTLDTVYCPVQIPAERVEQEVPPDSVSRIETATAVSTARITPAGRIHHTVVTRDTVVRVVVPRVNETHTITEPRKGGPANETLWGLAMIFGVVMLLRGSKN